MVVNKIQFICGMGNVSLHYCRVCGAPYFSLKEAESCEEAHTGLRGERATTHPQKDNLNIKCR